MKNKNYILLWGATGFYNMGDEAMLAGNIEILQRCKIKIIVLSNYPEITSKIHNVSAKQDFNRLIEEETKKYPKLIKRLLFLLICFKLWRGAKQIQKNKKIQFLSSLERDFLYVLANCQALLIVGGGNLNDIFGWRGLIARFFTVALAKIMRKPVFLGAQTIGPLNKWWTRLLVKKFLEKVDLITLRENFSKNVLNEIGVKNERVKVVPDDAFNIIPINRKNAFNLLINEGIDINKIKKQRQRVIAITPRAWWEIDDKNIPLKIALEDSIKFLLRQNENYIIFVPTSFYPGLGDDDVKTSKEIISKLGISMSTNLKILSGKYNWSQLKGVLSLMDVVIGTSYHSIVFAMSTGVPALGLYVDEYYRLKIAGFFHLLGLEDLAIDVRNLNKDILVNKLENFLEREKILRENLSQKIEKLKNNSCYAVQQLVRFLTNE